MAQNRIIVTARTLTVRVVQHELESSGPLVGVVLACHKKSHSCYTILLRAVLAGNVIFVTAQTLTLRVGHHGLRPLADVVLACHKKSISWSTILLGAVLA